MQKNKLKNFLDPYDIVVTNSGDKYVTIKQYSKLQIYQNQEVILFNLEGNGMLLTSDYDIEFNSISKDVPEHILSMFSIKEIYKQKYVKSNSLTKFDINNLQLKWRRNI